MMKALIASASAKWIRLTLVLLVLAVPRTRPSLGAVTAAANGVELSLPLRAFQSTTAPADAAATPAVPDVVGMSVTVTGRTTPILLPILADTSLAKGQNQPAGTAEILVLRSGGASVVLLKPDLAPLAGIKPEDIQAAELNLTIGWKMHDGDGKITAYAMRTAWTEEATFAAPRAGAAWAGPQSPVDYQPEPVATLAIAKIKAGPIVVAGLAATVRQWLANAQAANGLLLQFTGAAGQINMYSHRHQQTLDAAAKTAALTPPSLRLGEKGATAVIDLNLPLIHAAIFSPADLLGAELHLKVLNKQGDLAKATVIISPLNDAGTPANPALATSPVNISADNWLTVPLPAAALGQMLSSDNPGRVGIAVSSATGAVMEFATPTAKIGVHHPKLQITIARHANETLFDLPQPPRPGVFVHVNNGHFEYGGQRLRLWGVCMTPRPNPEMAERVRKMGFNAVRLWGPKEEYAADPAGGDAVPFVKGDNSKADQFAHLFAAMKEQGLFIDCTGLMDAVPISTADNSWLKSVGGNDWQEWKIAAAGKLDGTLASLAAAFDERFMAARKRHIKSFLDSVNPYTGQRYAEEECIAIFELGNERAYVKRVLEKGVDKWPEYFQAKLQKQWNSWLVKHHADDAALQTAWGALAAGESLTNQTVRLAPMLANRADFPRARGDDFVHFLCDLVVVFNKDLESYARAQGPAGAGVAVIPFSYDTQFTPNLPWIYTSTQGDVANFGMYFWTLTSALTAPPSMYVMDSNTVEGKPTVIYETNVGRPNAFRAEYPLRAATIASWQDWDGMFWHFFSGVAGESPVPEEQYLVAPANYGTPAFYWSAVNFETDPALLSSLAAAGRIFLGGLLAPAPSPATYVVGRDGCFSFANINGLDMTRATFDRGARIRFEPDKPGGVTIQGIDESALRRRVHDAIASGSECLWDWPNARLILDAPAVKAYVGRPAGLYKFKDGIVVGEFKGPFICFVLASADGTPLVGDKPPRRVYLCATADAKNTGFDMNLAIAKPDGLFTSPVEVAGAIHAMGHAPVVADPVPFHVWWPRTLAAQYTHYDFALRQVSQQTLATNELIGDVTWSWMSILDIQKEGAPAPTPQVVVQTTSATAPEAPAATTRTAASPLDDLWNPLPKVSWADDYVRTYQLLRDGNFPMSRISGEDHSAAAEKTVTLADAELQADAPANVVVQFQNHVMTDVSATFVRPPPLRDLIALTEKQFGPAADKVLADTADKTSTVHWTAPAQGAVLHITLSETQGTISIDYQLERK